MPYVSRISLALLASVFCSLAPSVSTAQTQIAAPPAPSRRCEFPLAREWVTGNKITNICPGIGPGATVTAYLQSDATLEKGGQGCAQIRFELDAAGQSQVDRNGFLPATLSNNGIFHLPMSLQVGPLLLPSDFKGPFEVTLTALVTSVCNIPGDVPVILSNPVLVVQSG